MSTKTRAQLVNDVADLLFVGATGQTLSAEDYTYLDGKVDPAFEELAANTIIPYVPQDDEIPASWFGALSEYIANECGPRYGAAKSEAARSAAEDKLKNVNREPRAFPYLRTDRALRATAARGTYRGT